MVDPFGALRTFGLHKGYGLAVVCELLGGALTGGGTWHYATIARRSASGTACSRSSSIRPRIGQRRCFGSETAEFLALAAQVAGRRPASTRCASPASPSAKRARKRERDGISVDDNTWKEILAAGAKVKLAAEKIEALARG